MVVYEKPIDLPLADGPDGLCSYLLNRSSWRSRFSQSPLQPRALGCCGLEGKDHLSGIQSDLF